MLAGTQTGLLASADPGAGSYVVVFSDKAVGQGEPVEPTVDEPIDLPDSPPAELDGPAGEGGTDTPGPEAGPALPETAIAVGLRDIDKQKVQGKVRDLESRLGVRPENVFSNAIGGFSARLTAGQLRQLAADPAVSSIMPDEKTTLDGVLADDGAAGVKVSSSSTPRLPAGIVRVGATRNSIASIDGVDDRVDADIAIMDTGVDRGHPDLNVVGGYNCTSSNRGAWGDEHGHGTHVAGTVAARDDGSGVVGVAPGARIWSVKVLDSTGSGYLSWLICGIDWLTAQRDGDVPSGQLFEVANMSLRFTMSNTDVRDCGVPAGDGVHQAICRSTRAGVTYAVAAGNDERNSRYYRPAAYQEVITVSAIVDYDGRSGGAASQADYCSFYSADGDDTFADFSNFGSAVDITAPGKCVVSTYPGDRYAWMSGTSMATPHVAGGVALYRVRYPNAQPQQVRMALKYVAQLDWRTSTDPDSIHEKSLALDDFIAPPSFSARASAPTGWLGNGSRIGVSVSRTTGHTAPIKLRLVAPPSGISGSGSFSGSSGYLTLRVVPGTSSGSYSLTVEASDGELERRRNVSVTIDGQPPSAGFASPAAGQKIQASTSVLVSWTETDGTGSGIGSRTLQRQRASIRTPGSCTGTSFGNIGTAQTAKKDYTQTLTGGYCYRWLLTLRDHAGNSATVTSGAVLVDTSAPAAPTVDLDETTGGSEASSGVELPTAYQRDGSTIFFRGGITGELSLLISGTDSQSGVKSSSVTASSTSGWGTVPRSLGGNPATLGLSFGTTAVSTSLGVRSVNGAGSTGTTRTVAITRDATDPTAVTWSAPLGTTATTVSSVKLMWTGGADAGSGLAGQHWLRRERAPISSSGTCTGVSFSTDGGARLVTNGTTDSGLVSGYCYRWKVRTTDRVGNLAAAVTSGVVQVGGQTSVGPTVTTPRASFTSARVTSGGEAQLAVSWSATSTAGVTDHALRLSRDGGSTWTSVTLADPASPRALLRLPSGTGYLLAARARDGDGAWSAWKSSAPFSISPSEAEGSAVTVAGTWQTSSVSGALGGKVRSSSSGGARATFTFTGRGFALVGLMSSTRGKADVYVNGSLLATIDLQSTTWVTRQVVYSRSWSKSATRTVEVVVDGTSGRPRVDLDAFIVLGN